VTLAGFLQNPTAINLRHKRLFSFILTQQQQQQQQVYFPTTAADQDHHHFCCSKQFCWQG
jgi:hypothetical protein